MTETETDKRRQTDGQGQTDKDKIDLFLDKQRDFNLITRKL